MTHFDLDALAQLRPIDRVCFLAGDQIANAHTYMQVDDDTGKIVVDLTDLLVPSLNGNESVCRQLHTFAKSKYEDVVPAYNQALFSFYRQPASDHVVILMRTSPVAAGISTLSEDVITAREPLEQFLRNHTETERDCYIVHPKSVQSFVVVNDGQATALDVTEPVTTAWKRDPSRSLCYHLYEWFKMMLNGRAPSYEEMYDAYKFYTNDELGTMVVLLDGTTQNLVPSMALG